MKTLILTGWGWKDYACAAAVALRKYPDAMIQGISTRRLPEYLCEVCGYDQIFLLGTGLTGNPNLLQKAVRKQTGKSVKIFWISTIPFPESLSKEISSKIEQFVNEEGYLTDAAAEFLRVPYSDITPYISENPKKELVKQYHLLLDAAMYFYRNYQDEKAYFDVIRHIANGDTAGKWTDAENRMIEHYKRFGSRELVGKSAVMEALRERINLIAPHDRARVLILGESGTGKETVAQQIHTKSPRLNEPYWTFNCASVTPNLLESRFLGYEKGAFTGATERSAGLFEMADGGTLFLDEIGELPLEAQGILLRVLEGGRFTRMGGKEEITVDVRLIAATNRDLAAMVRDGKFREDLFYRLNVVQIRVSPLREHKSDIEQIANGYWLKWHRHRLNPEQIEALKQYDYPGNVRELRNLLERASVLNQMDFAGLIAEHKEMTASLAPAVAEEIPDDLDATIRLHVKRVYEKYNSNLSRTAQALNAARNTVKKYLEE